MSYDHVSCTVSPSPINHPLRNPVVNAMVYKDII